MAKKQTADSVNDARFAEAIRSAAFDIGLHLQEIERKIHSPPDNRTAYIAAAVTGLCANPAVQLSITDLAQNAVEIAHQVITTEAARGMADAMRRVQQMRTEVNNG